MLVLLVSMLSSIYIYIAIKGAVGACVLPGLVGSLSPLLAPTSNPTLVKFLSATLEDINFPFISLNWPKFSEQTFVSVASLVSHHAKGIM